MKLELKRNVVIRRLRRLLEADKLIKIMDFNKCVIIDKATKKIEFNGLLRTALKEYEILEDYEVMEFIEKNAVETNVLTTDTRVEIGERVIDGELTANDAVEEYKVTRSQVDFAVAKVKKIRNK